MGKMHYQNLILTLGICLGFADSSSIYPLLRGRINLTTIVKASKSDMGLK